MNHKALLAPITLWVWALAELRKHSATGETAGISWAADEATERFNLPILRDSLNFRHLCSALLRAYIEVLELTAERDRGEWSGAPRDPKVAIALNSKKVTESNILNVDLDPNQGESVDVLFEKYARENPGNVKTDTIDQPAKIMKLFFQSLPIACFSVAKLSKKEVRE